MTTKVTKSQDKTTLWIEYSPSDRNIILITQSGLITGVNYWEGIGEDMFSDYNRADERLTRFVMQRFFGKYDTECILPYPKYDEMIDFIDDAIWDFFHRDHKTIPIPSIGQWLHGCKLYPMYRSDNGLVMPCEYDDSESINIDEVSHWPFDRIDESDMYTLSRTEDSVVSSYVYTRISNLMDIKPVEKPSSAEDVTITIPREQLEIIREALIEHLTTMERVLKCPTESQQYQMFDMHQLESLMKYDVKVTLTAKQADDFCGENGIDLPIYE